MLAHNQPLDNTGCFGRQWASSCSGLHPIPSIPSVNGCRHDDLHSIRTMMGFHAVKLWQNETFHHRNHMNIIFLQLGNGTEGSKLSRQRCCRGANYLATKWTFVSVFPVVVLRPHLWRELSTDRLAMWVWLESSTPLVSNCVICRGSLGVGKRLFHRFFYNEILNV
jgi:hypothetical protein